MTYETDHCQISQIVNDAGGWFLLPIKRQP